jgi:uncharacterized protein
VLGTGAEIVFVPDSLRQHLKQAGIGLDVMQTGAAALADQRLAMGVGPGRIPGLGLAHDGLRVPRSGRHLKQAGIGLDVMQTGAAARTYNILMAENRKVAAASRTSASQWA